MEKSEKDPELREQFYETLETILEKTPKRDETILAEDFNAKTGTGYIDFRNNKFGKGQMNSSGRRLLEVCRKMDMVITNTKFKHKICPRTTWSAPFRNFVTWNGEQQKNPIRNQIDCIITRNKKQKFIKDSRSYGGAETDSDHKLVKMEMKIEWHKI